MANEIFKEWSGKEDGDKVSAYDVLKAARQSVDDGDGDALLIILKGFDGYYRVGFTNATEEELIGRLENVKDAIRDYFRSEEE